MMYQRILVPVDGSPTSDKGLQEAISLAKLSGGRICVLHVVDDLPFLLSGDGYGSATLSGDLLGMLSEAGERILADAQGRAQHAGVPVERALHESLQGRLCDRVVQQIGDWKADLVVLGTHGRRGVRRLVLGSDAEEILRVATVPVLLVRGEETLAA
ncbi:MAG TPA: universal stress protein [Caldimonas sp.]|jgi:nucleotide-binding universal stress UspA family protein